MDFEATYTTVYNFFHANQIVTIIISIILALFAYRKPKQFFSFLTFCVGLLVVFYIFTFLNDSMSSGSHSKDNMLNKTLDTMK
jgi:cell division protein FtsW (lipid II flippase)